VICQEVPDNVEEGPIGRVEVKISELKAMSKDILELSIGDRKFPARR